jgi:hypothetical protein
MKKLWSSQMIVTASIATTVVVALQTNLDKLGKDLPAVEKLVGTKVWEQMFTMGAELTKRLKEEQVKTRSDIANRQKAYSLRLDELRTKNKASKLENAAMSKDITALQSASAELQQQADTLVRSCGRLREDIKTIQGNVSIAAEFLETAINDGDRLLDSNTSELLVLSALDEQEKNQTEERERTSRFAGLQAAMLQTSVKGPQNVMQSMVLQLGNITKEQNASMMKLWESFDSEVKKLEFEDAALMAEQSQLNSTREMEKARKARLLDAVEFLRVTHEHLSKHTEALRLFARRLGHGDKTLSRLSDLSGSTRPERVLGTRIGPDADASKLRIQRALVLHKRADLTASLLKAKAKRDGTTATQAAAQRAADAAAEAMSLVAKLKAEAK